MNIPSESTWKKAIPILCFALLGLYFGAPPIISGIKDLVEELSFRKYRIPLQKCIDEKTAAASGTKVLGLDYACAIEIGATFYIQEPDKAIQLCQKFSPLPAQSNSLQTSACRSALERRLRDSSSADR